MTYRIRLNEIRQTSYWQNYVQSQRKTNIFYSMKHTIKKDLKKYNASWITVRHELSTVKYIEFDTREDWFEFKVIWS